MNNLRSVIVLALTMLVAACATSAPPPISGGSQKIGAPYRVEGTWYYPRQQPNYDETGIASWYGPGFHGRRTANGEVFNQNGLTAAHATLPIPANVRVTNLDNGRSLVVRVNDRGPFHQGRIIDLSARAADLLGFKNRGTARVRVQVMGPASDSNMAVASAQGARPTAPQAVPAPPPAEATQVVAMEPVANPLAEMMPIANPEPLPPAETRPPAAPLPSKPKTTINRAAAIAAAAASLLVSPAEAAPAPTSNAQPANAQHGQFFVQVGAFSDNSNAQALYNRVAPLGRAAIVATQSDTPIYRVRLGPIATREEASGVVQDLVAQGHMGAQIVGD